MKVEYDKEIKDKNQGWYQKYIITKTNNKPVDPDADYFVLRLDIQDKYGEASLQALKTYATVIREVNPDLARDIMSRLMAYSLRGSNDKKL